jgi:hypothetical protein
MKTLKYLLIGLSVIFAVIGFLAFALIELDKYDRTHAPKDYYKEELEFISKDPLPSCKILRNDYVSGSYAAAIIQLNDTDYSKVLKAVQISEKFNIVSEISFWGWWAIELIKKGEIDKNKVIMYEGYYGTFHAPYKRIGFTPPNTIIYEENLNY